MNIVKRVLAGAAKCEFGASFRNSSVLLLYVIEIVVNTHTIVQSLEPIAKSIWIIAVPKEVVTLVLKPLVHSISMDVVAAIKPALKVDLLPSGVQLVLLVLAGLNQLVTVHVIRGGRLLSLRFTHALSNDLLFNIIASTLEHVDQVASIGIVVLRSTRSCRYRSGLENKLLHGASLLLIANVVVEVLDWHIITCLGLLVDCHFSGHFSK